jgi:hypothetical protein
MLLSHLLGKTYVELDEPNNSSLLVFEFDMRTTFLQEEKLHNVNGTVCENLQPVHLSLFSCSLTQPWLPEHRTIHNGSVRALMGEVIG